MEAMREWTGMYTCTTEEADFINQILASYDHTGNGGSGVGSSSVFSSDHHGGFWNVGPDELSLNVNTESFYNSIDGGAAGFCRFSQESSCYSTGNNSGYLTAETTVDENNNESTIAFGMEDVTINTNSYLVSEEKSDCNVIVEEHSGKICGGDFPLETVLENHDESLQPEISVNTDQKSLCHSESSKKRSRATSIDKNKRNIKVRRSHKSNNDNHDDDGEEESKGKNKAALNRQNSKTTCGSEDDSNGGCDDVNGDGDISSSKGRGSSTALNLSGKTRASRGAATDPQSLYARKRRERINERLRILQNLVPNGTKVDISTMLEEAVHYVKFLQLQIKLLSSDDLWMYAPIAYNGMDIGLDLKR